MLQSSGAKSRISSINRTHALTALLLLDAVLALVFGALSWWAPHATYGTFVDLTAAAQGSLIFATLAQLSGQYVLIGAFCAAAAFSPMPHRLGFAILMGFMHIWSGIAGYRQIGAVWMVGDPWPDIVIHAALASGYVLASLLVLLRGRAALGKGSVQRGSA